MSFYLQWYDPEDHGVIDEVVVTENHDGTFEIAVDNIREGDNEYDSASVVLTADQWARFKKWVNNADPK